MAPVSYGDPGITILDAFDRFEAGDSAAELGQGDDDGNGEGAADDIAKEIVVNPAKSEEKKAAETLAADDDGDTSRLFSSPKGTRPSRSPMPSSRTDPTRMPSIKKPTPCSTV